MNINNNFLDDENIEGSEIIEETIEEIFEDEMAEDEQNEILSEAEKRIEQANLYQALLKHDLFAPGSARQEIIDAVRKEFKGFILSRLEILLGIKQEAPKNQPIIQQVQSPFSEEEVNALKAIAGRLVKKEVAAAPIAPVPTINTMTPSVQPVQQSKPVVQSVAASPQRTVKTVVTKRVIKNGTQTTTTEQSASPQQEEPVKKRGGGRKPTQNRSVITDEDLGQVAVEDNPALRPKPMPSQAEMDMLNARQADLNSRGSSPVQGEQGTTAGMGARIAAVLTK